MILKCHQNVVTKRFPSQAPVFMRVCGVVGSLPLFFGILLWLIYALNYILKGDFETTFLLVISFIKTFVA